VEACVVFFCHSYKLLLSYSWTLELLCAQERRCQNGDIRVMFYVLFAEAEYIEDKSADKQFNESYSLSSEFEWSSLSFVDGNK
jgi:hypothetical protein